MTRTSLPNRRCHEVFTFTHWQQRFHAGIGRATPSAPIAEVWLNSGKSGTQSETLARDSAVILSIALQYGVPLEALKKAIMRDLDGRPSGPIGHLIELLAGDGKGDACVSSDGRGPVSPSHSDGGQLETV